MEIIVSDIHIGASICLADKFIQFLESGLFVNVKKLILNGDVFDSANFTRLSKLHWKIIKLLRKIAKEKELIWVIGNHDPFADIIAHLIGANPVEEYKYNSGEAAIIVMHGHQFDDFIEDHPVITWVADQLYGVIQKIDKSHEWAKWAKHKSKMFVRCSEKIRERAIDYAHKNKCNIVCAGHSHLAEILEKYGILYVNSGSWTELPPNYVVINEGKVELKEFN